ncbi:hypothetical protein [Pontibacter beigongshangensis]|uniref:hypothetical protein n=1 Tax=Pontibacter beigongshangensis TaxID=2574733 RepID=UPI0016508664|nr:hypothetical protein [Pontibacter beigongshangensis]
MAIIHVWQAENKDFDLALSPDIQVGNVYDKNTASFHTIDYGAIGSTMNEKVLPGRYFVYVLLPKSAGNGGLMYSYTYFEIKKGETLPLKKIFSHDTPTGTFEPWDQNK